MLVLVCFQLSTLVCGLDAFIHSLDGNGIAVASSHHSPTDDSGKKNGLDHPCQVHAAHVFADVTSSPAISNDSVVMEKPASDHIRHYPPSGSIDRPPIV